MKIDGIYLQQVDSTLLRMSIEARVGTDAESRFLASGIFHRLWGKDKESVDYNKDLWVALQLVLFRLGDPV